MQLIDFLILGAGILGTWGGAELLIRGSAKLALTLGLRPMVVGLTVVALGTSSPEAVVSLMAAFRGSAGIALGNVVGSNIANIGLVLGLLALLHPIRIQWSEIRDDLFIMVIVTGVALLLMVDRVVARVDGILLLVLMLGYIAFYLRTGHAPENVEELRDTKSAHPRRAPALLQTIGGLALLYLGARWLLTGATSLAAAFGVPDAVIGVTMVAIGTSLPELAASVVAVARGHHEIGVGNIVGSNVMNIVFVLGLTSTVQPLDVGHDVLTRFVPIMLGYALILIPMMRTGYRLSRAEGALLLAGYLAFGIWVY